MAAGSGPLAKRSTALILADSARRRDGPPRRADKTGSASAGIGNCPHAPLRRLAVGWELPPANSGLRRVSTAPDDRTDVNLAARDAYPESLVRRSGREPAANLHRPEFPSAHQPAASTAPSASHRRRQAPGVEADHHGHRGPAGRRRGPQVDRRQLAIPSAPPLSDLRLTARLGGSSGGLSAPLDAARGNAAVHPPTGRSQGGAVPVNSG